MDIDKLADRIIEAVLADIESRRAIIKQELMAAVRPYLAEALVDDKGAKQDADLLEKAQQALNDMVSGVVEPLVPLGYVEDVGYRGGGRNPGIVIMSDSTSPHKAAKMKAMEDALASVRAGVERALAMDKFIIDDRLPYPKAMIMNKVTG